MKSPHAHVMHKTTAHVHDFDRIYAANRGLVYRYFLQRTGYDPELAQDLMQETFFRAYRHFPQFKDEGYRYQAYLMTIAHNILVNHYRKHKSVPLSSMETDGRPLDVPAEDGIELHLEHEDLARAIEHLTPFEQDILAMAYLKGLSLKDISRRISRTIAATKILLFRIRNKVRGECKVNGKKP